MKNYKNNTILISASYAPSLINFRRHLILKLIDLKYNIVVLAPGIDDQIRLKLENIGCTVIDIELKRNKISIISDLIYMYQMYVILKSYKPLLLLSYTAKPNVLGAFSAKLANIRSISIISGLGINFTRDRDTISSRVFKFLFRISLSMNSFIIYQNQDDLNELLRNGFIKSLNKVGLVNGSGVDIRYFDVRPLPKNTNFLMVARFLKSKGVLEYLEAAKAIKLKKKHVTFTLIGADDHSSDSIDREYIKKNYAQYVTILDEVEDIRPIIESSSVIVLPSYREGTPRSVLEAMAMGRAIITTDVPGCRETVIHKENGFLAKAKDLQSLIEAMTALCEDPELIASMSQKSRKMVEEKFEVEFVSSQYIQHMMQYLTES